MRFRRDEIAFRTGLLFDIIILPLLIFLIVFLWDFEGLRIFLIIIFLSLFVCAVDDLIDASNSEYIFMDEQGISCFTKKGVRWQYAWSEILELKRCFRLRSRALYIVRINESDGVSREALVFQLGRSARKAIKLYYKAENGAPSCNNTPQAHR